MYRVEMYLSYTRAYKVKRNKNENITSVQI